MALFNYATKEITLKIVYYGPGLSGKTTNIQHLHSVLEPDRKGKLLSLATEADRTLFFDFMPVALGKIRDFNVRFQLYTVPGQIRYNATRRLVLKGADAVVFVADSQREMREQNVESFQNMRENLTANNIDPDDIPVVLQYNKRDLQNILAVEELQKDLNSAGHQFHEAEAINGKGVEDTFETVTRLMLRHISRKHKVDIQQPAEAEHGPAPRAARQPAYAAPAPEAAPHMAEAAPGSKTPGTQTSPGAPDGEMTRILKGIFEVSQAMSGAAMEISAGLRNSQMEAKLSELVAASNAFNSLASELLEEIRDSKRQQAQILNTLAQMENALQRADAEAGRKKGGFRLFGK
ncbi:MAG: hypothetical protein Kow0025_19460 [Thermodesulfovibrionales bacterium]